MDKALKLQNSYKQTFEAIADNIRRNLALKKESIYYEASLEELSEYWTSIKRGHSDLIQLAQSDPDKDVFERDYFKGNQFQTMMNTFCEIKSEVNTKCNRDQPSTSTTAPTDINNQSIRDVNSNIKLPKLTLDKFSGDYEKWPSFHDMLRSLIHDNESLSDVQRLQYLKLHLVGEPERLLRDYQVTENNYSVAWKVLKDRYENNRVLVNTQLKKLFTQNYITQERAQEIRGLLDTTSECILALQGLSIQVDGWEPILVYITIQKLPTYTHQLWEQSQNKSNDYPRWEQLEEFLENRVRILEAIQEKAKDTAHTRNNYNHQATQGARLKFNSIQISSCPLCQGQHHIRKCPKFLSLGTSKRMETVKTKNLCRNCLSPGHKATNCSSQGRCFLCKELHHTLLHSQARTNHSNSGHSVQPLSPIATSFNPNHNVRTHTAHTQSSSTLLATALMKIVPTIGQPCIARALIDPGSQASLITEAMVQQLGLPKDKIDVQIRGIGESVMGSAKARVKMHLCSLQNDTQISAVGIVVRKITTILPETSWRFQPLDHINTEQLADPEFRITSKIDILLGADIYADIILEGMHKEANGTLVAQKTIFGWILCGGSKTTNTELKDFHTYHMTAPLDEHLKRFWELEELPTERKIKTDEELKCERIFEQTHKRLPSGKYEVQLPLAHELTDTSLGYSRTIALQRFIAVEKKLSKNPKLKEDYQQCIMEYSQMGHMSPTSSWEDLGRSNYLPHHAVIKEASSTTKLRVVFDASRATTNGSSLNDIMTKGPVIQRDLTAILLTWRQYKIAFTADIEKMYRQINIYPPHAELQRILWRNSASERIQDYKLTTVTFGTKSAPYLATKVLQQLATDERTRFPLAATKVLRDFYVDDLLSGAQEITEAKETQTQLINLLKSGGFRLRKWASNSKDILKDLPEDERELKFPLCMDKDEIIKTLGIYWNPSSDNFSYVVNFETEIRQTWTKRKILSEVAKLFDPLGWLAPIVITAKIMIQNLWLAGTHWDQEAPKILQDQWKQCITNLPGAEAIKIPRWLQQSNQTKSVELHGFCDASTQAYAAVVYMCTVDQNGYRNINLLMAKTKVAPMKTISLPRLELCGATLLAKLIKYVSEVFEFAKSCIIQAWTDSKIVLAWLRTHPSKWNCFVGNRVAEIHSTLGENLWGHVSSKENPADCATRGLSPTELHHYKLWWNGPEWLQSSPTNWPQQKSISTTEQEKRKTKIHCNITQQEQQNEFLNLINNNSSYNKIIRITSWMLRFINNIRHGSTKISTPYISSREMRHSTTLLVKLVQKIHFIEEIKALISERPISAKSKLIRLSPFLDENQILRVGGRLQHAQLRYDEKFPTILPDKSRFTKLLIQNIHKETLHGGPQLMMSYLIRKFWIINARNTIRFTIHKCVSCYRQRAKPQTQLMGALPSDRLKFVRPFVCAGLDYCGPFDLKAHRIRKPVHYKAYIALFICMAVKAVHLELVTDLTADAFIAAYRRFASRRGKCAKLYCDNGTNFVSANKDLKRQNSLMMAQLGVDLSVNFENEGVEFKFIPPSSPHFGGLWEAGVKSTKTHLKRVIGNSTLTYEEFSTILTQIEACLNSRPLCPMSDEPSDLRVLTPSHFLIGDVLLTPPEPLLLDTNINRLDRWQYAQRLVQQFWKQWQREFASRLQQRPKWLIKRDNISKDDLVLLTDEMLPPSRWLLGRVLETHPGADGLVRVVTIKSKNAVLKRPITKLCILPLDTGRENTDKPNTNHCNNSPNTNHCNNSPNTNHCNNSPNQTNLIN